jgi:multidrug resistance protein, MATE family
VQAWVEAGIAVRKEEGLDRPSGIKTLISRSWSVSWPMTVIMSFEFLIGITDVYIAGRVSKEVQATYGFVIQLYFIFIVIANALTVGTVSVVSRLSTSGDRDELSKAVFSSLATAAIAGILLAAGGIILTPFIIPHLGIPPELKRFVLPFVDFYAVGLLFHYLLINSNGILRSCNMVKVSLKTMALVCLCNIGLNFLYVFHTPLGYRGIAAATASSVLVGSLLNLMAFRKIIHRPMKYSRTLVRKIVKIGWPMGLNQALWQLGSMVLFLILSLLPEHNVEILAALTTGLRIESAIYLPAFAFNMANAVIIGNWLGEKRHEEAFKSGLVTATIGVLIVTAMVIAVITNAHRIVSFLSHNEIVIRESVTYLYISMLSEPVMAWGIILGGGLSGAGDTRSVLWRVALSVWLVRIPLCYLFVVVFGFGVVSVWWSMNLSQLVQAFFLTRRYFGKKWLTI